jgi:hypothetical protein
MILFGDGSDGVDQYQESNLWSSVSAVLTTPESLQRMLDQNMLPLYPQYLHAFYDSMNHEEQLGKLGEFLSVMVHYGIYTIGDAYRLLEAANRGSVVSVQSNGPIGFDAIRKELYRQERQDTAQVIIAPAHTSYSPLLCLVAALLITPVEGLTEEQRTELSELMAEFRFMLWQQKEFPLNVTPKIDAVLAQLVLDGTFSLAQVIDVRSSYNPQTLYALFSRAAKIDWSNNATMVSSYRQYQRIVNSIISLLLHIADTEQQGLILDPEELFEVLGDANSWHLPPSLLIHLLSDDVPEDEGVLVEFSFHTQDHPDRYQYQHYQAPHWMEAVRRTETKPITERLTLQRLQFRGLTELPERTAAMFTQQLTGEYLYHTPALQYSAQLDSEGSPGTVVPYFVSRTFGTTVDSERSRHMPKPLDISKDEVSLPDLAEL